MPQDRHKSVQEIAKQCRTRGTGRQPAAEPIRMGKRSFLLVFFLFTPQIIRPTP
jgi:hypothetical protein